MNEITVDSISVDCTHWPCQAKPGEECWVPRGRVFGGTPTGQFGQNRWVKPDGPHAERIEAAAAVQRYLRRSLGQKVSSPNWLAS